MFLGIVELDILHHKTFLSDIPTDLEEMNTTVEETNDLKAEVADIQELKADAAEIQALKAKIENLEIKYDGMCQLSKMHIYRLVASLVTFISSCILMLSKERFVLLFVVYFFCFFFLVSLSNIVNSNLFRAAMGRLESVGSVFGTLSRWSG